jgi:hypothetical protein
VTVAPSWHATAEHREPSAKEKGEKRPMRGQCKWRSGTRADQQLIVTRNLWLRGSSESLVRDETHYEHQQYVG